MRGRGGGRGVNIYRYVSSVLGVRGMEDSMLSDLLVQV